MSTEQHLNSDGARGDIVDKGGDEENMSSAFSIEFSPVARAQYVR